jgi:hypothetical protein
MPNAAWRALACVVTVVLTAAAAAGQDVPASSDKADTSAFDRAQAAVEQEFGLPVSIEKIRIGLERGMGLKLAPVRQPDFRVKIVRIEPFDLERALARRSASEATVFRPAAGIDLLSLIRGAMSQAARERGERQARETVRRAEREFCLAHPDRRDNMPACAEAQKTP